MRDYKTITELGIDFFHKTTLEWQHPCKNDLKSGELLGKSFRIGGEIKTAKTSLHSCLGSDWVSNKKPAIVRYRYGEIEASTTFFKLPANVKKRTNEIKEEILILYKNSKLYIPKKGCQMHGDITAELTLECGNVFFIPWNY